MILQASISEINSREECIPFLENGMLPLITAPMYSVVDENNYKTFIDNKVNVCLPRNVEFKNRLSFTENKSIFISYSLNDFIKNYILKPIKLNDMEYICIDTANGNMQKLHDIIIEAKRIYDDKLIIMAGNVSSFGAFITLAKTGVDYIRVGIGGGSACSTASNTGVGQSDLESLIYKCYCEVKDAKQNIKSWKKRNKQHEVIYKRDHFLSKVKIVADGISTYIKQCEIKYGFNDNGYAAINKLLYAGADLIMIGSLFAQSLECAADKYLKHYESYNKINQIGAVRQFKSKREVYSQYYGMSTHKAQAQYKPDNQRSSEGSVNYLPIRYTLSEWLYGSNNQDNYPYLSGWVNCLKSAMSYTDSLTLNKFKS